MITPTIATSSRRLAAMVGVTQVRHDDTVRDVVNGGTIAELRKREEAVVVRLERIAEKMEKALS